MQPGLLRRGKRGERSLQTILTGVSERSGRKPEGCEKRFAAAQKSLFFAPRAKKRLFLYGMNLFAQIFDGAVIVYPALKLVDVGEGFAGSLDHAGDGIFRNTNLNAGF